MSKLDEICDELEAYKQMVGSWVKYGDYVNIIRPRLTKEQLKEIQENAEKLKKSNQRRNKYGKADSIHRYQQLASASAEPED